MAGYLSLPLPYTGWCDHSIFTSAGLKFVTSLLGCLEHLSSVLMGAAILSQSILFQTSCNLQFPPYIEAVSSRSFFHLMAAVFHLSFSGLFGGFLFRFFIVWPSIIIISSMTQWAKRSSFVWNLFTFYPFSLSCHYFLWLITLYTVCHMYLYQYV